MYFEPERIWKEAIASKGMAESLADGVSKLTQILTYNQYNAAVGHWEASKVLSCCGLERKLLKFYNCRIHFRQNLFIQVT